ncbi:MAG: 50S ribosome-binding GTPase [Planctomycetes bacterium]|nr:50S ribosome-binding GTPase [Planctomycetota bacterium]MCL4731001.1 50S ribosome-binding GTPase [Planctomycetota bacterium]
MSVNFTYHWLSSPGSAALALLWLSRPLFAHLFHKPLTEPRLVVWRHEHEEIDRALAWPGGDGCVLSLHGGAATRAGAQAALQAAGACPQSVPNLWETTDPLARQAFASLPAIQGELGAKLLLACATHGQAAWRHYAQLSPEKQKQLAHAWAQAEHLYQLPRIQLWGVVNAGKSSLLNALCGQTLAAAGPEPGLTRDVIEGRLEHAGFVLRLFDAPGTGHGGDELDHTALALAERWRAQADLTLELVPPGAVARCPGALVVYSQSDRDPQRRQPGISVHDADSLTRLKQVLVEHFVGALLALPPALRVAWPPEQLAEIASQAAAS